MEEFKWKELNICKIQLSQVIKELEKEIKNNETDISKQFDIISDIGLLKHSMFQLDTVKSCVTKINEKYRYNLYPFNKK